MAKASQFLRLLDREGQLIRGECDNEKRLDWIMVSAWDWGVTDPAALPKKTESKTAATTASAKPVATGGRGGVSDGQGESTNEITPQVFTFTKQTDRSTTRLMMAMDSGIIFPEATLVIEEQFEKAAHPFHLEINFVEAFLINFSWSASASGAGRTFDETWKLNYSKIKFDYDWRGGAAARIPSEFTKSAGSSITGTTKTPRTKAEEHELAIRQINDELDARERRNKRK